uniref:hypothetical protein n=1 Tax=Streptomyces achromogenes TaxID=67255 RepID=UPI003F490FB6
MTLLQTGACGHPIYGRSQLAAREEHLRDLRRAMLALTAGPVSEGEQPTVPAQSNGHDYPAGQPVSGDERSGRRRWWRRG